MQAEYQYFVFHFFANELCSEVYSKPNNGYPIKRPDVVKLCIERTQ